MLQKIKTKYPIFTQVFLFLLIISISVLILKIFGLKNWDNNFATVYSSTYSPTPNSGTYMTNGTVHTIIPDKSGGTYIGGFFSFVGTDNTGDGVPILSSTGFTTSIFPKVNGVIYKVISDNSGGWYIGGNFTQVGVFTRNHIAHILSDGTVDQNFNPNLNGSVQTMVLSISTNTLYIGGNFTTVSGTNQKFIAALDITNNGSLMSFNPNPNAGIYAMAFSVSTNTLYLGGAFTALGVISRSYIAAVNTSGNLIDSFKPTANGLVEAMTFSALTNILYIGGNFTAIDGIPRSHIAALSASTGIATPFPNANDVVNTLNLSSDESILYMGGGFTAIGTTPRNRIAAVNTSTGIPTVFNPDANLTVFTLAPSSDGNTIYMGGVFTKVGGVTRNRIAAVDKFGNLIDSFNPTTDGNVFTIALSSNESVLYVGGIFNLFNGIPRNNLAHILSDGTLDLNFNPIVGGPVYTLALSASTNILYIGGQFNTGTATLNNIFAVNASTGSVITTFNPNTNGQVLSLALSSNESVLYVGGSFTTVGTTLRNRIAAVNTSTGIPTAFNPNANGAVLTMILSTSTNILYIGGNFTDINGTPKGYIAALDTANNGSLLSFNPNVNNAPASTFAPPPTPTPFFGPSKPASTNNSVGTLALSPDENTLYIGGNFTTVGTINRNFIAAVNATSGAVTSFNPNTNNKIRGLALSLNGDTLYMGGDFTTVGGVARNNISAVNATSGAVTAFNPNMDGVVSTLALSSNGSTLYAGGFFNIVEGVNHNFFTSFSALLLPTVYTVSATSLTETSGNLNGSIIYTGSSSYITERGFRYGLSDKSLSSSTSNSFSNNNIGAGTYNLPISSLICGTTYYYQAIASNIYGEGDGSIESFTTSGCSTIITPNPTTPTITIPDNTIGDTWAILYGTINVGTDLLEIGFHYGISGGPVNTVSTTTGLTTGIYSLEITNLTCGTTYSYQAYAINSAGEGGGVIQTFTTLVCPQPTPPVTTPPPSTVIPVVPKPIVPVVPSQSAGITVQTTTSTVSTTPPVTQTPVQIDINSQPTTQNNIISNVIKNIAQTYSQAIDFLGETIQSFIPSPQLPTTQTPIETVLKDDQSTVPDSLLLNIQEGIAQSYLKTRSVFNQVLQTMLDTINSPVGGIITKGIAIIGILLTILYILYYFVFKHKKVGTLRDKATHLPLSFAAVKIFKEGITDTPIINKIADKEGRYYILIPKGNYVIQIDKKNDDGSYTQVYKSGLLNFDNGVINQDVEV